MRLLSTLSIYRTYSRLLACIGLCALFLGPIHLRGQDANLSACNSFISTNWIAPTFSLTATGWTDPGDAIDNGIGNFASTGTNGATLRIADDVNYTSAGYFVGVHVGRPAFTGGGNVVVKTYSGITQQDSYTVNVGGGVTSTQEDIGFYTNKPFNAIEIQNGSGNTIRAYYVFLQRFCSYDLNLACNTYTPVARPNFAATVGSATGVTIPIVNFITNEDRAIDNDPDNFATIVHTTGAATFDVVDPVVDYPASTTAPIFAGFDIRRGSLIDLSILNNITISTYLNGSTTAQETATGSEQLLLGLSVLGGSSGRQNIGFAATKPFDEIRIRFTTSISASAIEVYGAIIKKFCAGPEFACNTNTYLNESTQPLLVDPTNTGFGGFVCLNCKINNTSNGVDGSASTAATVDILAGAGNAGSYAIKNPLSTFPASTTAPYFVGFDIENSSLVGANLLSNITIETLDANGTTVQSVSATNGLVSLSSSVLNGSGRQTLGFLTTQPFSTLKIIFTNTVALSLGQTTIYNAIVKRFCASPTIACSKSAVTPLTNTTFPVYINSARTGVGSSLACVGCAISNTENVINSATSSPATISLGASVSATARFSVANPIDTYPAESYVGFDIESSTLLSVNLLGSTRITLYNNGSAVQTGSGASLLTGATLLSGSRQTIGTIAQVPFDEVVIEFQQLVGAGLGTINIYRAVIQKACVTPVACNQTKFLNTPDFSAFIEGTRTGFTGLVSTDVLGSSSIENTGNVISASTTDFARITNIVGASVTATISVADPADVYPAGTFAGFTISKANLPVSLNLFSNITVKTYLNGVYQESSATNGNLIDLSVFLQIFGGVPSGNLANVGFVTSKPFDEIQINVGSFASVLNYVDVYGAFIDTRTSSNGGSLVCNFVLNPDFNVTTKNVPVSGNVSTNDVVPTGTTYGTPVASAGNPSGATITLNTAGVYSFTATAPGTYTYTVSVCATGQTTCPTTPSIITVLDPTVTTNNPVANPDYASVLSSTATAGSVTINVRANDGPGNPGGVLGTPTITTAPTHGTAVITGGNVVYTPTSGFIGDDILTYQVCETPGSATSCSTATVTIHVVAPGGSIVTIVDDYVETPANSPVSSNVLTNDLGAGLTVSNAGTITVPGKGTLVITAAGSYTFTPATGVTGPVDFTYTACDGSGTCGTATLHVLVKQVSDLTIATIILPGTQYGTSNFTLVGEVFEINETAVGDLITVYVTKDPLVSLGFSNTAVFVGGRQVQNSTWTFDAASSNDFYILTTISGVNGGGKRSFGLTGVLTPGNTKGKLVLTSIVVPGSGGEIRLDNNSDADTVDYFNK